ncbi:putative nitronate monooxygenase [Neolecta irregularis DAH-3]|uniref:Putative nitronate monooxygenase n=1 Tax=Neolecta irregularis (strain DAH-3) TaxID=1198029 RepID=A0A1U7LS63_NEOID|nr:putative nitronate monooxygenase [Neolecta irregularis DAH-3]|eukprot:OLL25484.1 putative nitronate monooxygenase [Neolecta irregularis DAH-3]
MSITTPLTKIFGIKHPVILAGMNVVSHPTLAAAVSNAGGLGVIGGHGYTPAMLREQISDLKSHLARPDLPFGVDLLIPQVGGSARKTNYDYTKGTLPELVEIIIDSGAKLFVSAIGVPPKVIVDKLHQNGIYVMNMIGHPKHVRKALEAGVDIICAQGTEGGGHTGSTPTSILIPQVVQLVKGHKMPLTGEPILVVAAGGINDGKSLAAALMYGASAVWIGTRFICAKESGAPKDHQDAVLKAGYDDTIRTVIFTGRPLRVLKNPYIMNWEENRQEDIKRFTSQGIIPCDKDLEDAEKSGLEVSQETYDNSRPFLMGEVAAAITEIQPAKQIVEEIVAEAVEQLKQAQGFLGGKSKL